MIIIELLVSLVRSFWSMQMENVEKLKKEIEQALTYFIFWDSQRHLPTAAETADYFAGRLQKLNRELDDAKREQHSIDRKSDRTTEA